MPLSLQPPRVGYSHNWRVRGTHRGVSVDKTSGTPVKAEARAVMRSIRDEIDRGAFAVKGELTFAEAVEHYMNDTGQERFLLPLVEHFGDRPIRRIDARMVDDAAAALYPSASPATRNRQVYTPISAVLRHSGIVPAIKRPKGAAGGRRVAYLEPAQAFAIIKAARARDTRFGALLTFLLYTGARLNEALALTWTDVSLPESRALIRQTKTEGARTAALPPEAVSALDALPRGKSVFRLTKCGRLYTWLGDAAEAAGVAIPDRVAFHLFRHTWATWMRRYGGLDTAGLVATGAWRSRVSASVYEHLDASEEAGRAMRLPAMEMP